MMSCDSRVSNWVELSRTIILESYRNPSFVSLLVVRCCRESYTTIVRGSPACDSSPVSNSQTSSRLRPGIATKAHLSVIWSPSTARIGSTMVVDSAGGRRLRLVTAASGGAFVIAIRPRTTSVGPKYSSTWVRFSTWPKGAADLLLTICCKSLTLPKCEKSSRAAGTKLARGLQTSSSTGMESK